MGIGALAVLASMLALNSGQWLVAGGQRVTGVTPTGGGRQGITSAAPLPDRQPGLAPGAVPPAPLPAIEMDQVKLNEKRADPEKEQAAAVERAKAHLVKTLEVEPAAITLESASAATWPDTALGCPEQDRMYAQVLTSGYKVLLKVDGKTHEVHVAGTRAVSCPARSPK